MYFKNFITSASVRWNRFLREGSMRLGMNLGKPSYVCAKMTMLCNSRCVHCNIWNMEHNEKELSTDQWLRVLDELRQWLGRFPMVFTGGEALLRDDMPVILEYAVKLGIHVELLSNGLAIDDGMAARVVATGIDQVTISYDGISPSVHDSFRGEPGYHSKTTAAILSLDRHRKQSATPMTILLKTVISANNLHELAALAQWAQEYGFLIQYQPLEQNYGEAPNRYWYKDNPFWITDLAALRETLDSLSHLSEAGKAIVNNPGDFGRFLRYFEQPEILMTKIQAHDSNENSKSCSATGNFVISSNGDVRMCFGMDPIGNVTANSPVSIWRQRVPCWSAPCKYR